MKKIIIWITSVIILLLIGAYFIFLFEKCPKDCDDGNICTTDYCNKDTKKECAHDIINNCNGNGLCEIGEYGNSTDCPDCTDNQTCTEDIYNYENQKCYNYVFKPCDGNEICEEGEFGISADCPSCDDKNDCTQDNFDYIKEECIHKNKYPCCGNDVCEATETFLECNNDCVPTNHEVEIVCSVDDECKIDYALKLNQEEICFTTSTKASANECITKIAIKNKDFRICENSLLSEKYDNVYGKWVDQTFTTVEDIDKCEQEVIILFENISTCKSKLVYPNKCIQSIALREKNITLCNEVIKEPGFTAGVTDFQNKCKYVYANDYPNCKFIKTPWLEDQCIEEIAIRMNEIDVCEEHSNPGDCERLVEGI